MEIRQMDLKQRNDPFAFILNCVGMKIRSKYLYVKIITTVVVFLMQINSMIFLKQVIYDQKLDLLVTYGPEMVVEQACPVNLLVGILNYAENFFRFSDNIMNYWPDTPDISTMHLRYEEDSKRVKLILGINYFIVFLMHLSFLPFTGDEEDFIFSVMYIRQNLGSWSDFVCCLYYIGFLFYAYGTIIIVVYSFFIKLCDDYDTEEMVLYNQNEQEKIYRTIVGVVQQQIKIKGFETMYRAFTDFPMVMTVILGSLNIVAALFCLLQGKQSIRMFLTLLRTLTIVSTLCHLGEVLADEHDNLIRIATNCPWFLWNKKNRLALLMVLNGSKIFPKIKFYNIMELNYTMITNVIKAAYSLLTVFRNLNDTK